jgi:hypothetical protein
MQRRLFCFALTALLGATAPALSAQELDWARKMFSELEHDFGVVARGADVRHRIQIKNLYKETVTLSSLGTSCNCIAATLSQTVLPSEAVAELELTIDTKNHLRQKDPHVDVRLTFAGSQGQDVKDVRIPVHVYIRSDVVFEPGAAEFGSVDLGAGAAQRISIKYAGRDDWQIREVRSPRGFVRGSVREVSRGGGRVDYELTVQLDPDAPQGALREQLQLVTNDSANPYVPLVVSAVVEPDIVVATPLVPLGSLTPGVDKTVRVILRGRKPFSIETIECESALECFKVKLPKDPKSVHILPLTVTPPAQKGEFGESFSVHIAGRTEPLTFRAAGMIE